MRERRGWMRPALQQKKGKRVFFQPLPPFLLFLPLTTRICRFIKSDVYSYHFFKLSIIRVTVHVVLFACFLI
ncbi:hypothetical protein TS65_27425 [Aneurinibacillus migulanus]|uniref:Uncharacterized protein n=1 Tax=Aneurinibacillus migulanus TaxID=47500 RepID=A0A0D1UWY0_ANEMI|nr:hypothetical protein TS65_27425 [Aneurinibacillus migulanus]KON97565.1 hypothetical protein AF333_20970 [Aneurinibacillus migulanus]